MIFTNSHDSMLWTCSTGTLARTSPVCPHGPGRANAAHSFACFFLRTTGSLDKVGHCSDCLMRLLQRSDLFTAPNLSFDDS